MSSGCGAGPVPATASAHSVGVAGRLGPVVARLRSGTPEPADAASSGLPSDHRIAVLGPLQVRADDSAPVDVPGARQRLLLGVLAAAAPRPVAEERLTRSLGSRDSPPVDVETLRAEIRRLRTALEPGLPDRSSGRYVLHRGSGYALAVARGDVDALRFADLAARGHAHLAGGDADDAVHLLAAALGLWAGEPYCDWPGADFAEAERRRLEEVRSSVESDLAQARELLAHRPAPTSHAARMGGRPLGTAGRGGVVPAAPPVTAPSLPAAPPHDAAVGPAGVAAPTRRRNALLIGALAAAVAATLVAARISADGQPAADRSATVAEAERLAARSATEDALDVSLLLAAQAFRLADTPATGAP